MPWLGTKLFYTLELGRGEVTVGDDRRPDAKLVVTLRMVLVKRSEVLQRVDLAKALVEGDECFDRARAVVALNVVFPLQSPPVSRRASVPRT